MFRLVKTGVLKKKKRKKYADVPETPFLSEKFNREATG